MKVGKLRKKLTIQSVTETQNAYGEPVQTWATHAANRWTEVVQRAGDESFDGKRFLDTRRVVFRIRYTAGVRPKMRVLYNGEDYDIQEVFDVGERRRFLELTCDRTT